MEELEDSVLKGKVNLSMSPKLKLCLSKNVMMGQDRVKGEKEGNI